MWYSAVGCIVTLILSLLMAPRAAHAQRPAHVPRIGYLDGRSADNTPSLLDAFRQALRELGYVEGQHITIAYRYAEEGGVSNVDIDGNNTLQIKGIGVIISTFETLPICASSVVPKTCNQLIDRLTVRNILRRHHLEPAPQRRTGGRVKIFLDEIAILFLQYFLDPFWYTSRIKDSIFS
jgi:hypothetical protein